MKLEEYLEGLRNCPDELVKYNDPGFERDLHMLTTEFGIYDNWPILMKSDFDKVVRNINNSGKYKFLRQFDKSYGRIMEYNYILGTIVLEVRDWSSHGMHKDGKNDELIKMLEQQYNMTIMLFPYQKKKIPNISAERSMFLVIEDLCEYIKKEKISACFPKSRGWSHLNDYSRIVYYEP